MIVCYVAQREPKVRTLQILSSYQLQHSKIWCLTGIVTQYKHTLESSWKMELKGISIFGVGQFEVCTMVVL